MNTATDRYADTPRPSPEQIEAMRADAAWAILVTRAKAKSPEAHAALRAIRLTDDPLVLRAHVGTAKAMLAARVGLDSAELFGKWLVWVGVGTAELHPRVQGLGLDARVSELCGGATPRRR